MTENENLSYEEEDVTTKAGLVGDNDFLTHAQRFLQKRTHKFYSKPEEIYSEWIEQFRSSIYQVKKEQKMKKQRWEGSILLMKS